jgi:hypothetical protein
MSFPLNPVNLQEYTNSLGTTYQYIAADTKWVIKTQNIGLTGLQGETGSQGNPGSQGDTGLQGITGLQGSTGSMGETGAQGVTGLIGETGVQGVTGVQGSNGASGNTGLQGETGLQGVTGLQGETGLQGITGLIGETGAQGIQGVTGLIGNTGIQGVTGLIGNTGIQGVTGLIGATGASGGSSAIYSYLTSDLTTSGTTVTASNLTFNANANTVYSIECMLFYGATASSYALCGFTGPSGATGFVTAWGNSGGTSANGKFLQRTAPSNNVYSLHLCAETIDSSGSTSWNTYFHGVIKTGGNSGTFTLLIKGNSNSTKIAALSWLRATPIS